MTGGHNTRAQRPKVACAVLNINNKRSEEQPMGDKGKKDKDKREGQKKEHLSLKEKRKQKKQKPVFAPVMN